LKKLEKILHVVNLVLIILFSVHLMSQWFVGWVFDALFFNAGWYVPILCVTLALERWCQVFTGKILSERFVVLVSALLLTVAGVHLWWAAIVQPVDSHDDNLLCLACLVDAIELYLLPGLVWAAVRLGVNLYRSSQAERLLYMVNFGVFAAWLIHTLMNWGEAITRYGFGFYMSGGYYAGRIFIPVLMLVNVALFLTRNARETVQGLRS
jgi:hypothetical protein